MIQPSLSEAVCLGMVKATSPGAQTGAGAVPGRFGRLLGGMPAAD